MELRNSIGTICARTVLGTVVSQRRPRFHKKRQNDNLLCKNGNAELL